MPEYTPTEWQNETPASTPVKYRITDDTSGEIAASAHIEPVTEITPGTPLNSTTLNHIEQGIKDAQDTANAQVDTAKLIDGILSADATGRAKMADGFVTLAKLSADLRFQKVYEFVADGESQIDWVGIPQDFRHLLMVYNGISSRAAAGWDGFYLRVNGDSGNTYYVASQQLNGSLTGTSGWNHWVTNPNGDGLWAGILPAQNAGYLDAGSGICLLLDYSSSAFYKTCLQFSMWIGSYDVGALLSTTKHRVAEPITRLTGNMGIYVPRAGSVFTFYGLP